MILLLFAFYALCHYGSLIIITKYYCYEVPDADSQSLHIGFLLN